MCNNIIYLTPHFTLRELCESRTAEKLDIDNVPSWQEVENLRRLCEGTLEPLRVALQMPVIITSGFRNKTLNDKLSHSTAKSQHLSGCAADFYVDAGLRGNGSGVSRRELLIKAFRTIILNEEIDYDQLILYPTFIHVSYVSREANRRRILISQKNGKRGYGSISMSNALKIK